MPKCVRLLIGFCVENKLMRCTCKTLQQWCSAWARRMSVRVMRPTASQPESLEGKTVGIQLILSKLLENCLLLMLLGKSLMWVTCGLASKLWHLITKCFEILLGREGDVKMIEILELKLLSCKLCNFIRKNLYTIHSWWSTLKCTPLPLGSPAVPDVPPERPRTYWVFRRAFRTPPASLQSEWRYGVPWHTPNCGAT